MVLKLDGDRKPQGRVPKVGTKSGSFEELYCYVEGIQSGFTSNSPLECLD